MLTRRRAILALGASVLTASPSLLAQPQIAKVRRIVYLTQGSEKTRGVFLAAFRDGLRELGWVDGRNIVVEVHWAPPWEFGQIAATLVTRAPDAFVGTCIPSTRAAKNATSTIPVIMSVNGDPVEAGLVASYAHPGANVTGAWTRFEELVPKWLEIVARMVPGARTVAVLANPESVADEYWWGYAEQAAKSVRVRVVRAEAHSAASLDRAFAVMAEQGAGAFVLMIDAYFLNEVQRIVSLATRHRIPGVYGFLEYAQAGGLVSYGVSYREYFKGVARYVDKVLRGADPADLPVEQPARIELAVNLGAAKRLGLTIPGEILVRADRVFT